MTSSIYNPQVFFASERTLLAWQRSSIAFIALGFVIERFGIFIKFLSASQNFNVDGFHASAIIGIVFILLGSTTCLLASIQHQRFVKTLNLDEIPRDHFIYLAPIIGYLVFLASCFLAFWILHNNAPA
jgi:putative membrane protein